MLKPWPMDSSTKCQVVRKFTRFPEQFEHTHAHVSSPQTWMHACWSPFCSVPLLALEGNDFPKFTIIVVISYYWCKAFLTVMFKNKIKNSRNLTSANKGKNNIWGLDSEIENGKNLCQTSYVFAPRLNSLRRLFRLCLAVLFCFVFKFVSVLRISNQKKIYGSLIWRKLASEINIGL